MMRIGLIPHLHKPMALSACRDLAIWLEARNIKPRLTHEAAVLLGREDLATTKEQMAQECRFIIVFGGDGTLLSVIRSKPLWGVPVLGINLGKLGFLTEIELKDLFTGVDRVLQGELSIQERMMLQAKILQDGNLRKKLVALNDVVVSKGSFSRMLRLDISVDKVALDTLPCDGVIIATPTGSTAYSLSAGGPIVDPNVSAILVTPICAHSLHTRPMVIAPESKIEISVRTECDDIRLTIDGQASCKLSPLDTVVVDRAPIVARFLKLPSCNFYDVLRQKLGGAPHYSE